MTCRFEACTNEALPNQSRCDAHRLRWLPGKPVELVPEPEWMRRRRTDGLPAKDYSRSAA